MKFLYVWNRRENEMAAYEIRINPEFEPVDTSLIRRGP